MQFCRHSTMSCGRAVPSGTPFCELEGNGGRSFSHSPVISFHIHLAPAQKKVTVRPGRKQREPEPVQVRMRSLAGSPAHLPWRGSRRERERLQACQLVCTATLQSSPLGLVTCQRIRTPASAGHYRKKPNRTPLQAGMLEARVG